MNVYEMHYPTKELHRKIKAMFNAVDLEIEFDNRGYIKKYKLTDQQTIDFINRWNPFTNTHSIREKAALNTIEQLLGIRLRRQVKIGCYRVDGLHETSNTVYEIDEEQHYIKGKLISGCILRQKYLEDLGYTVKRIKV